MIPNPILTEPSAHLYRFASCAAKQVLRATRKWRDDLETLRRIQIDLPKAEAALCGYIETLELALHPILTDGVLFDPRDDPGWRKLPYAERIDIARSLTVCWVGWKPRLSGTKRPKIERLDIGHHLEQARGGVFSGAGFSGHSAHEIVRKLGEATLEAVQYLLQCADTSTLESFLGPDSVLRTETQGLGKIPAAEAKRLDTECEWEAEEAWAQAKSPPADYDGTTDWLSAGKVREVLKDDGGNLAFPTHKKLLAFLDAHPDVPRRRPSTKKGTPNPHRLEVRVALLVKVWAATASDSEEKAAKFFGRYKEAFIKKRGRK